MNIDPALHKRLVDGLKRGLTTSEVSSRDALLSGLPQSIATGLNRSQSNTETDLKLIVTQLSERGRLESGQWPLLVVIDNALSSLEGTEAGQELKAVRIQLNEFYEANYPADDKGATQPSVQRDLSEFLLDTDVFYQAFKSIPFDPDVICELLKKFFNDPQSLIRESKLKDLRHLPSGSSSGVILELTLDNEDLCIFKISETLSASNEIRKTEQIQKLVHQHPAFGSAHIKAYESADGHWIGFVAYIGSCIGGSTVSVIESDIRKWSSKNTANLFDSVFDLLNNHLYHQNWRIDRSAPPIRFFDPKLFPLALADGDLSTTSKTPGGSRKRFWGEIRSRDKASDFEQFRFCLEGFKIASISQDRRTVICHHPEDETDELLKLQLKEALPEDGTDSFLSSSFYVTGKIIATRTHRYKSVFPEYAPIVSEETCRGVIHGDLNEKNILIVHPTSGEVITPVFIDFSSVDTDGVIWWDYVRVELALRNLFLQDHPEEIETLAVLDAFLNIVTLSWVWQDQSDLEVIDLWNKEFSFLLDLPLPFLRLRRKAFEFFISREDDRSLWVRDYFLTLYYGALIFLGDHHEISGEYYSGLARLIQSYTLEGALCFYRQLPMSLRVALALDGVGKYIQLANAHDPLALSAVSTALNVLYTSGNDILLNIFAKEEPPLTTLYAIPDLVRLSHHDVSLILQARSKIRRENSALVGYRENSRTSLRQIEHEFAYLRGRYEIPLKARAGVDTPVSYDVILLIHSLPCCVVLGGPGSGKTTLASFLRFIDCSEGERLPVPVVLSFGDWSTESANALKNQDVPNSSRSKSLYIQKAESIKDGFKRVIGRSLGILDDPATLDNLILGGNFLFIVDGLNEMPQEDRPAFVSALKSIQKEFPGNRFWVSSRTIHYRNDFADWPTIVLEELTEDEAKSYIRRCLRNEIGDDVTERSPERLIEKLFGTGTPASVKDLARSPMFLTFLIKYFAMQGALPNSRGKLFKHISDDLLNQGEKKVPPVLKQIALAELAFSMLDMENQPITNLQVRSLVQIGREDAITILDSALESNPAFKNASSSLLYDTNAKVSELIYQDLLDSPIVQGHNNGASASFHHQAFLEFYASLKLIKILQEKPEEFLDKLEQRMWHETLHTLVGYDSDDTREVVQAFLRHTPDIHYRLMIECLTNAEYVDTEVRKAIIERLRAILWDVEETLERRAGSARALASLARLAWDDIDVWGILLDHLETEDVCPQVITILLENLNALTSSQSRRYFSRLYNFVQGDNPTLWEVSISALIQNDTFLAGATATNLLLLASGTKTDPLLSLMSGLEAKGRVLEETIKAMLDKRDFSKALAVVRAFSREDGLLDLSSAYDEILQFAEEQQLSSDITEAIGKIPTLYIKKNAERWRKLAYQKVIEDIQSSDESSSPVWLSILAKSGDGSSTPNFGFECRPSRISPQKITEIVETLRVVPVSEDDHKAILTSIVQTLHTVSLLSDVDKSLVESIIDLMFLRKSDEILILFSDLVVAYFQKPIWPDLISRIQSSDYSEKNNPLLRALIEKTPLGETELTANLNRLKSLDNLERGRAFLSLCRPIAVERLSLLVKALGSYNEHDVQLLFLLGLHSAEQSLSSRDLDSLCEYLSELQVSHTSLLDPDGYLKKGMIRQGFSILEQGKYFAKNGSKKRERIFCAALRCLGQADKWFSDFMIVDVCERDVRVIEDFAKRESGQGILLLCRFLSRLELYSGYEGLSRLLRKPIINSIKKPGRLERYLWSDVIRAIGVLKMTEAEDTLIKILKNYGSWKKYLEEGTLGAILARGDPQSNAFHEILETLHQLESVKVYELVFSSFNNWDIAGRQRSLLFLKQVGWPEDKELKKKMGLFLAHNIETIVDSLDAYDAFESLFSSLKDSRDAALLAGRSLRLVARDKSKTRLARELADKTVAVLEGNNDILVPYEVNALQKLIAAIKEKAKNG